MIDPSTELLIRRIRECQPVLWINGEPPPTVLAGRYGHRGTPPRILLKLDSQLPLSGSSKARGGFPLTRCVGDRA